MKGLRGATIGVVAVLAAVVPASAQAGSLKLSLKAHGLHKVTVPGFPYAQQTGFPATLAAGQTGALARGAKLRLAVQTTFKGPFHLTATKIRLHNGHAILHVSRGFASTVTYRLVEVSPAGAILARSGNVTIFWVAPPKDFVLTDGNVMDLDMYTGKLSCAKPSGPNTCTDTSGTGSGGTLTFQAYTAQDRVPGTRVTLSYQGQTVCTSTAFDGQCSYSTSFGTVAATFYVTATAQFTSLSGKTWTLTEQAAVYP